MTQKHYHCLNVRRMSDYDKSVLDMPDLLLNGILVSEKGEHLWLGVSDWKRNALRRLNSSLEGIAGSHSEVGLLG